MSNFDTLAASRTLQDDGKFSREQADCLVNMVDRAISSGVATSAEIRPVRSEAECRQSEVYIYGWSVKAECELLRDEMSAMATRITNKVGGMIVVGFSLVTILGYYWR